MLRKNQRIKYTPNSVVMKKFKYIVEDLDIRRKSSRLFMLFMLARKMIHTGVLIRFSGMTYIQLSLLVVMSVVYLICLIKIRPFTTISRLTKEIIAEVL